MALLFYGETAMEANQNDPDSTTVPNPSHVWPREPDDAKAEAAWPAAEDDPDQPIEEPGYGHGV
jgi:hypothetical protein